MTEVEENKKSGFKIFPGISRKDSNEVKEEENKKPVFMVLRGIDSRSKIIDNQMKDNKMFKPHPIKNNFEYDEEDDKEYLRNLNEESIPYYTEPTLTSLEQTNNPNTENKIQKEEEYKQEEDEEEFDTKGRATVGIFGTRINYKANKKLSNAPLEKIEEEDLNSSFELGKTGNIGDNIKFHLNNPEDILDDNLFLNMFTSPDKLITLEDILAIRVKDEVNLFIYDIPKNVYKPYKTNKKDEQFIIKSNVYMKKKIINEYIYDIKYFIIL